MLIAVCRPKHIEYSYQLLLFILSENEFLGNCIFHLISQLTDLFPDIGRGSDDVDEETVEEDDQDCEDVHKDVPRQRTVAHLLPCQYGTMKIQFSPFEKIS